MLKLPAGIKHLDYTVIPILNSSGEVTRIFEIFSDHTIFTGQFRESEILIRESPDRKDCSLSLEEVTTKNSE